MDDGYNERKIGKGLRKRDRRTDEQTRETSK